MSGDCGDVKDTHWPVSGCQPGLQRPDGGNDVACCGQCRHSSGIGQTWRLIEGLIGEDRFNCCLLASKQPFHQEPGPTLWCHADSRALLGQDHGERISRYPVDRLIEGLGARVLAVDGIAVREEAEPGLVLQAASTRMDRKGQWSIGRSE